MKQWNRNNSDFKQARIRHHNVCINGGIEDPFECTFCRKNITKYNEARRQTHISRCAASKKPNEPEHQIYGIKFWCPICKKEMNSSSTTARISHLKACAKKHDIRPLEIEKYIKPTKTPKANGPPKLGAIDIPTLFVQQTRKEPHQTTEISLFDPKIRITPIQKVPSNLKRKKPNPPTVARARMVSAINEDEDFAGIDHTFVTNQFIMSNSDD